MIFLLSALFLHIGLYHTLLFAFIDSLHGLTKVKAYLDLVKNKNGPVPRFISPPVERSEYSRWPFDKALQDLRDIFDYIFEELKSPGIAAAQVRRIRDEVRSLNIFPNRYKVVDWEPWMTTGMRRMPVDNFVVFYVVAEEITAVQVVRIIYGKRDISNIVNTKQ